MATSFPGERKGLRNEVGQMARTIPLKIFQEERIFSGSTPLFRFLSPTVACKAPPSWWAPRKSDAIMSGLLNLDQSDACAGFREAPKMLYDSN